MKLAEFNALCDREWAKTDRGGRGDVVSLLLTEASHEELSRDKLMHGFQHEHTLYVDADEEEAFRNGKILLSHVVNPVTRTPVKIRTRPGGKRETARVRVPGGYRQTWWPAST